IDYREEITVLGRDEGGNPEVLGSTVSLREDHLAKSIGQERELVFFLKGGLTERT
ncbi:MAG: hypothetical protein HN531_09930, partial [Opitutae bacterium]|nr:hypothetical protein [Opitutae bacterium]